MKTTTHSTAATILIVDDEPRNIGLIRAVLDPDDYDLISAESGEEALMLASEIRPDLVLLDVMMPGMDGYEVCRRLRAMTSLETVPVVMVTALTDREALLTAVEAGADEFLSKPLDVVELRTRVRCVTRLNRVQRLASERAKFELIADRSGEGYLLVDRSGRVTYANAAAGRLAPGMLEGVDFLSVVVRDWQSEPEADWGSWAEIWEHPGAMRYLLRPPTAASEAVWLRVELEDLNPGRPDERLCRISDVSAMMNRQRELWSFHSVLCHKFRTPLTGLTAGIDLLAMDAEGSAAEIVAGLQQSIHRLSSQIQSVLEYVSAPHLRTDDALPLASVLDCLGEVARREGAVISVEAAPEVGESAAVRLSPKAVESIAVALVDNSVRYHPEGKPVIEVTVRPEPDGRVCLTLTDDGCRIEPRKLAKVGQPYFQAEKHFTGEAQGMGIGLAMVASILWECGGLLRVANREDRPGVVVRIILPFQA